MPKTLNIGLIGVGRLGAVYARYFLGSIAHARLSAVSDVNEKALQAFADDNDISRYCRLYLFRDAAGLYHAPHPTAAVASLLRLLLPPKFFASGRSTGLILAQLTSFALGTFRPGGRTLLECPCSPCQAVRPLTTA